VTIEQVEEAKLLGITLDSPIDKVVKMGRGPSVIKTCSAFLTQKSTGLVVQDLVLSHFDYCPVIESSAANKYLAKLQLAQHRAAHLVLNCTHRTNINNMHASLSCLRFDERLTTFPLVFMRNVTVMKIPDCLHNQITSSSDTHK
jgi:hypothetical protein